jgi:DNA-directed RNA polymerase specialized sigma24 family protein
MTFAINRRLCTQEHNMATMAFMEGEMNTASFVSTGNATWCLLLLEHLEEFAKLAWYLVADGGLVEETFTRTMVQLDVTPLDTSIPELAYNQAREILISQAIAVLANTRREEEESGSLLPVAMGDLPDLPRLAFMLRLVVRSSEVEVAKFLDVSPAKVRELVRHAIDHLSANVPYPEFSSFQEA